MQRIKEKTNMIFPFFVARRYLFSKKSTNVINLISGVSVVGVAVTTMALVVTLSVFNGFHDLVASLFTSFDPQISIAPAKGKLVPADDEKLALVRQLPEVMVATESVEDLALAVYDDHQATVRIKGVTDNFDSLTNIRSILIGDGEFILHAADLEYGVLGIRLAQNLVGSIVFEHPMQIYAPKREGQLNMANPMEGFEESELYSPSVLFCVNQSKYDKDYIITSIGFARQLFDCYGMLSTLELKLKPEADIDATKRKIEEICGADFIVRDRYEQQADTYKIMKVEKLIAYIFLTFILVIACFNIIGSLSMLMIDKKEDVVTLRNLGATNSQITGIFMFEGRLISLMGAVFGILLGLLLCWLQQEFGLVGLGRSSGTFIVEAYPVSVHYSDVLIIFVTVIAVGFVSVWYPVRYFAKRLVG